MNFFLGLQVALTRLVPSALLNRDLLDKGA